MTGTFTSSHYEVQWVYNNIYMNPGHVFRPSWDSSAGRRKVCTWVKIFTHIYTVNVAVPYDEVVDDENNQKTKSVISV